MLESCQERAEHLPSGIWAGTAASLGCSAAGGLARTEEGKVSGTYRLWEHKEKLLAVPSVRWQALAAPPARNPEEASFKNYTDGIQR